MATEESELTVETDQDKEWRHTEPTVLPRLVKQLYSCMTTMAPIKIIIMIICQLKLQHERISKNKTNRSRKYLHTLLGKRTI